MTNETRAWTQEQVSRLAVKLQQFMDNLAKDEQQILKTLLQQAADGGKAGEVKGYGAVSMLPPEMTIYGPAEDAAVGGDRNSPFRRISVTIPLPRQSW